MATPKTTTKPSRWPRLTTKLQPATDKVKSFCKVVYAYLRLIVLAGAAGMWVYTYTKAHITMGGADAVAGVVAVIVVAHLLGGLKALKH